MTFADAHWKLDDGYWTIADAYWKLDDGYWTFVDAYSAIVGGNVQSNKRLTPSRFQCIGHFQ